jgi:hypothetical protein
MEDVAAPPHVQARLDVQFGAGTTPAAVQRILAEVRSRGDAAGLVRCEPAVVPMDEPLA